MEQNNTANVNLESTQPQEQTPVPTEPKAEPPKAKPEFTPEQQELVNKIVARELAKVQTKTEKRIAEIQEAEKLKNMSEEERRQAELESYKKKVAEYEKQHLISQFKVELSEKGLPAKYADVIPVGDAEQAANAVKFLSDYVAEIKTQYEAKITELETQLKNAGLRGAPPKSITPAPAEDGVSAKFREMNPHIKI